MEEDLEKELQEMIAEANKEREEELAENANEDNDDDNSSDGDDDSNENNDTDDNTDDDDNNDSIDDDDSDNDDDDDNDNDDNEDSDDEFEPIEIELDGTVISVDSKEELLTLAKKGLNSVDTKPRADSEADVFVKQGNLTKEDLTLLIDAKNGDVNAIAKLAELAKVDVLDIEEEKAGQYKPSFEVEVQSEVEAVAGEILKDTEHATAFKQTVEVLPDDFVSTISSDAQMLKAFSNHIKSGLAQKVIPLVKKEIALNGGSFFDNYAKLGKQIAEQSKETPKQEQPAQQKRELSDKEKRLRARASGEDKSSSSKPKKTTAEDIANMSDEEFAKLIAPKQ